MRHKITPSLVAGAVISAIAVASPPPKHDAVAYAPPAAAPATVTSNAEVVGSVRQFILTPLGTVEGVLLEGNIQILFPAHMGERVASSLKRGDVVGVAGRITGDGAIEADRIVRPDGRVVARRIPLLATPKRDGVVSMVALEARGVVQAVLRGHDGEINGVVLADGTVVHLAPHILEMLEPALQPGLMISISGYGMQTPQGRAIEATAISAE